MQYKSPLLQSLQSNMRLQHLSRRTEEAYDLYPCLQPGESRGSEPGRHSGPVSQQRWRDRLLYPTRNREWDGAHTRGR